MLCYKSGILQLSAVRNVTVGLGAGEGMAVENVPKLVAHDAASLVAPILAPAAYVSEHPMHFSAPKQKLIARKKNLKFPFSLLLVTQSQNTQSNI